MVRLHGDGAITYGMRFTTTLGNFHTLNNTFLRDVRWQDLVTLPTGRGPGPDFVFGLFQTNINTAESLLKNKK